MSSANEFERQMLELINAERAKAGVDPVTLELDMNDASERHSEWMLDKDTFSHSGAGGSNAKARMEDAGLKFSGGWSWSENIAIGIEGGRSGISDDVAKLHDSLMNSSSHRKNILDPNFDVVGIGIETGKYNGFDAVAVTQNFASTSASVRLDGGSEPEPEPENTAPTIKIGDITLDFGALRGVADLLDYSDRDGDSAVRYEIRGDASFRIGDRKIDVDGGFKLDADDLATLKVASGGSGDRQEAQVRAFDGEDWSGWDTFVLSTGSKPEPEPKPEPKPDPEPKPAQGRSEPEPEKEEARPDPKPESQPEPETAPALTLEVDDFELAALRLKKLGSEISLDGAGDASVIEVRDDTGRDNFWMMSRGRLDADDGFRLSADDIDDLWIQADLGVSKQTLAIRAGDGDSFGDWTEFTLASEGWDF